MSMIDDVNARMAARGSSLRVGTTPPLTDDARAGLKFIHDNVPAPFSSRGVTADQVNAAMAWIRGVLK